VKEEGRFHPQHRNVAAP